MGRVLVIGLDGFEVSYADQLIAEGMLPTLAAQRNCAATVLLEHGAAQRSGLGWEHFWSGLTPEASGRKSAVEFDPSSYGVWQEGARFRPFFDDLDTQTVVFDAPYGEALSRTVIDLAKAKYPNKPIKYLVQTHHHMDHSGGLRAYVAEGATILVAAPTRAYFNRALGNPRTVANDAQQKARKPVRVTEVKDQMTLKDDAGGEIRIYNIKNPHSDGYLLGHVVKENVVFVTDLISPRGAVARTEGTLAVGEALKKHGIANALIAGGHGTTAKQAEIGAALGVEVSSR